MLITATLYITPFIMHLPHLRLAKTDIVQNFINDQFHKHGHKYRHV